KFEVVFSGDGKNVMTGSYNNNFMIYPSDPAKETEIVLQADKSAFKAKKVGIPMPMNGGNKKLRADGMRKETDADAIDFNKKILHMSWHPFEDSIPIAATNNVGDADGGHIQNHANFAYSFLFSQLCREEFTCPPYLLSFFTRFSRIAFSLSKSQWCAV